MPLKSQSQRRFMWATDPAMARRWEDHTPKGTKLPEKVKKAMLLLPLADLVKLAFCHQSKHSSSLEL